MHERCENCRYWEYWDAKFGGCRRYPPTDTREYWPDGTPRTHSPPVTVSDDWCGEFKAKDMPTNPEKIDTF